MLRARFTVASRDWFLDEVRGEAEAGRRADDLPWRDEWDIYRNSRQHTGETTSDPGTYFRLLARAFSRLLALTNRLRVAVIVSAQVRAKRQARCRNDACARVRVHRRHLPTPWSTRLYS